MKFCIAPNPIGAIGLAFTVLRRTDWWQLRGGFKTMVETDVGEIEIQLAHPYDVGKRDKEAHGLGAGDGTVPESSGKALDRTGQAAPKKEAQAIEGIKHEPAYHRSGSAKPTDGVSFTVDAVRRLGGAKIKRKLT